MVEIAVYRTFLIRVVHMNPILEPDMLAASQFRLLFIYLL